MRIGILYDVPAPTAKSFTETNALVAGSWLVADLAEKYGDDVINRELSTAATTLGDLFEKTPLFKLLFHSSA